MSSDFTPLFNSGLSLLKNQIKMGKSLIPDIGKGDIISGKIIDVLAPAKYLIRVRGNDIIAESDLNLNVGDIYKMEVLKTDSKITVKLLPSFSDQKEIPVKAAALLQELELPLTSMNKNTVEKLLSLGVKYEKDNLPNLINLINEFRKFDRAERLTERDIAALIFTHINKLKPVHKLHGFIKNVITNREQLLNTFMDKNTIQAIVHIIYKLKDSGEKSIFADNLSGIILNFPIVDKDNPDLPVLIREYSENSIYNLVSVLSSKFRTILDRDLTIYLIKMLSIFQQSSVLNSGEHHNDKIYYSPLLARFENNLTCIEIFYRKLALYPENMDPIPGFEINLLIYMNNSEPVHVNLVKKVPRMLNIGIYHPLTSKLKFLQNLRPELVKRIRNHGYNSVKIDYHISDTESVEYRTRLFFPKNQILKSVDFTG